MDCGEIVQSENTLEFFIQYTAESEQDIAEAYGADCAQIIDRKYAIVYYNVSDAELEEFQEARYINNSFPRCFGTANAEVLEATGISALRRNPNFDLYGNDVIIGFVDSGIDFDSSVFKKADGTTRIISAWNQEEVGVPPKGLIYGKYYSEAMINEVLMENFQQRDGSSTPEGSLQQTGRTYGENRMVRNVYEQIPLKDNAGHGSYIASVAAGSVTDAAGSIRQGTGTILPGEDITTDIGTILPGEGITQGTVTFSGAAPLSDIICVKLKPAKRHLREYYYINEQAVCFQETDILLGVKFLIEQAAVFEKPIVIVIALETNLGGHDGSGILEEYLRYAAGLTGVCVVAAAGNEGGRALHFRQTYGTVALRDAYRQQGTDYAEIRVGERERGFTLALYASSPALYGITVESPAGQSIVQEKLRMDKSEILEFLFDGTIIYLDAYVYDRRTGGEVMILRFETPSQGIWRIGIKPETLVNNAYLDIWLPIHEFLSSETYFINPSPDETITNPGNESTVITVAGYDYRTGASYIYSGRGFSANGAVKPDISAPAVDIPGAAGIIIGGAGVSGSRSSNTRIAEKTGTGVATALAAGAAAMLLEWGIVRGNRETMDTSEIKTLLIRGARNPGRSVPDRDFGFGLLDIYGAFRSLIY